MTFFLLPLTLLVGGREREKREQQQKKKKKKAHFLSSLSNLFNNNNDHNSGTLSSYAYVLMCVHLLQTRRPHPALPVLQSEREALKDGLGFDVDVPGGVAGSTLSAPPAPPPAPAAPIDGGIAPSPPPAAPGGGGGGGGGGVIRWRVRYSDDPARFSAACSLNRESLAELLWAFFEYWSWHHDYANSVVSVRTGGWLTKAQKDWTRRVVRFRCYFLSSSSFLGEGEKEKESESRARERKTKSHSLLTFSFSSSQKKTLQQQQQRQQQRQQGNERHLVGIEDPFETSHDLGRTVDRQTRAVLHKEFTRAATLLRDAEDPLDQLFQPYRAGSRNNS